MNLIITGGGTGGHLSIAKALALECKNRGFEVIYIGSTSGQDKLWFEHSEIFSKCYFLQTTGVVNKKGFGIIKALNLQFKAMMACRKIFTIHKIDAVISVGGFSAGGASSASITARIPLFIHEQNAIKGTLNNVLSPFAKAVFGSFKLDSKNFIQTPYPINEIFFKQQRLRKKIKTILFLGGSQGAKAINDFALSIAKDLQQRGIKIIHQCGKNDFERVKEAYKHLGICTNSDEIDSIDLFGFDNHLVDKITMADFCVSRAGASSLWELCANGLVAYFIPYPYAAKNHQYFNAMYLKNQGLCEVMPQNELDRKKFLQYLDSLNIESISKNLLQITKNNGTKQIIDEIIHLVK